MAEDELRVVTRVVSYDDLNYELSDIPFDNLIDIKVIDTYRALIIYAVSKSEPSDYID